MFFCSIGLGIMDIIKDINIMYVEGLNFLNFLIYRFVLSIYARIWYLYDLNKLSELCMCLISKRKVKINGFFNELNRWWRSGWPFNRKYAL
jgi:hypothetical protein